MLKDNIQYDFLYDNHFAELKDTELMQERFNLLAQAEPYIGKYYSQQFIRTKILRQTDGEMVEEDKQIEKEIESGAIPDPALIDPVTGEQIVPSTEPPEGGNEQPPQDQDSTGIKSAMGSPIQDNDIEVNVDKSTKMPEKGLGEI
jgi:hypothetical protein